MRPVSQTPQKTKKSTDESIEGEFMIEWKKDRGIIGIAVFNQKSKKDMIGTERNFIFAWKRGRPLSTAKGDGRDFLVCSHLFVEEADGVRELVHDDSAVDATVAKWHSLFATYRKLHIHTVHTRQRSTTPFWNVINMMSVQKISFCVS